MLEAEIVGFDPFADVALLKVEPEGFPLHPLELGDDTALEVGEPVAAIGSPFGEQRSLSVGVVSATDRAVKSLTQFKIEGAIQTDASINPGNSGGPLLEEEAKVVGINQQIETNSGANDGVGFAVPISAIEHSVQQLREKGHAEYAYIGVSSQPVYPQLAQKLGLDTEFGALVANVVPGGPAAKAGLRGATGTIRFQAAEYETGGDVIVEVEGQEVVQPEVAVRLVDEKTPGEKIELTILRDNKRKQVDGDARQASRQGRTRIGRPGAACGPAFYAGFVTQASARNNSTGEPCRTRPLLQEVAIGQKSLADYAQHRRQGDDRAHPRARRAAEGQTGPARLGHRLRRRRVGDPLHDRAADARRRHRRALARDLRQGGVLRSDQAPPQLAAGGARDALRRAVGDLRRDQPDQRRRAGRRVGRGDRPRPAADRPAARRGGEGRASGSGAATSTSRRRTRRRSPACCR